MSKAKIDPAFAALYDVGIEIGRGSFSVVHHCVNKSTKQQYAVKVINKHAVEIDPKTLKRLQVEKDILKQVTHPHIIPLHEIIETATNLYLVMELVSGGELFDKIVEKGNYSERDASKVIKNAINAIQYLHSMNIAHRDLKPENLLVKESDDTHVMISDFGLSRVLGEESRAFTACGTPYYEAPEVVDSKGYGKEVDMWSIGVITYFLLAGYPPFMGDTLPEIVEQIVNADYDFPVSATAKDFVSKLLVVNPSERLTAEQALAHPWLKEVTMKEDDVTLKGQQCTDKASSASTEL